MEKMSKKLELSLTVELRRVFGSSQYLVSLSVSKSRLLVTSADFMFSRSFFIVLSHWCRLYDCSYLVDFSSSELVVFKS